jgi:hypothetical protein
MNQLDAFIAVAAAMNQNKHKSANIIMHGIGRNIDNNTREDMKFKRLEKKLTHRFYKKRGK